MLDVSNLLHNAALLLALLALLGNVVAVATRARLRRVNAPAEQRVAVGASGPDTTIESLGTPEPEEGRGLGWYSDRLIELSFVALTVSLILRSIVTGHAPFANQFEFSTAFAWAVLGCFAYFEWRYKIRGLALLVLPIAVALLFYASNLDKDVSPLIPALQNSLLLTVHVFTAVIGNGAAAVSFAAAVLFLARPHIRWKVLPSEEVLEEIGYRAVVLAFPMLTLMIVLGALWADTAWGRYWSWDPKETAALVTWLIYGAYLHARVIAGWRGNRAAWLLILGFVAVVFTFLGNHWFGGLHSYA